MNIKEILTETRNKIKNNKIEDAGTIARVLLQFVLKCDRNKLILIQDKEIEEKQKQEYENLVDKIIEGLPLQYITNNQEFYGINFYVNENVLIPQPDTEILVEEVLKLAKSNNKILDICTGSGCIGISIASKLENVKITLSDISIKALEIAKKNALNNNVSDKIKIIKSDMFENLEGIYDIIVSNPPYIETNLIKTLSKQVQNEPILALNGGDDGLEFYRILLKEAPKYLEKNGKLCMEIGYNQKEQILEIANEVRLLYKYRSGKRFKPETIE